VAGILALATFLIVAVVAGIVWMLAGGKDNNRQQEVVRRRMEAVRKAETRGEVSLDLKLVRDELYSNVPVLHRFLMRLPWSGSLQNYINQAGLKMKAGKFVLWTAVAGLGTYVLISLIYPNQGILAFAAGLLALAVPIAVVAFQRMRRLAQFEERFPEALDLIGRAVRAGHAFTTGLEMVSKESSEPVAGEFRATFEEQNFGLPLRDALLNMAERVPLMDVRFFVTALLVQKETGGNLAELLDELSRLIRERFRIYREVKVRTAQGRLTAAVLIALPFGMLIALEFVNPDYVKVLWTDPIGPMLLGGAAALQVLGSLVIWKIVHIEV
jgi:tight adherence protein B